MGNKTPISQMRRLNNQNFQAISQNVTTTISGQNNNKRLSSIKQQSPYAVSSLSPQHIRQPVPPPEPTPLLGRKERYYIKRINNITQNWCRQQDTIRSLQGDIRNTIDKAQIQKAKMKKAIVKVKFDNDRMKKPLKLLQVAIYQKDKILQDQQKSIALKNKIIYNRERSLRKASVSLKRANYKIGELERKIDVKDKIEKYLRKQMKANNLQPGNVLQEVKKQQQLQQLQAERARIEAANQLGEQNQQNQEVQGKREQQQTNINNNDIVSNPV